MTERTPQQIGRSNRRAGKAWQLACAAWLRDHGFPHAAYEIMNGRGDITGVDDLNVECTTVGYDKIFNKLEQSREDAERKGLTDSMVWKRKNAETGKRGVNDPGQAPVIMDPVVFWDVWLELVTRRRQEWNVQAERDRATEAIADMKARWDQELENAYNRGVVEAFRGTREGTA